MNSVLKWILIVVGALVALVLVAVLGLFLMGSNKLSRDYQVQIDPVTVPADGAALERGEHLVEAVGVCIGCHGEDLGGAEFLNDPGFAVVYAPNLTPGNGGVGVQYEDEDWVLAIRHGVGGDGRGLIGMPSQHYTHFGDEDLGAMVAYLKTLPPVDRQIPVRQGALPAKIFVGLGAFPLAPDLIDHQMERSSPSIEDERAYGGYLSYVAVCRDCHAANLAGNTDPNGPPLGPNITPGGELSDWTEEDFITALRTGRTPEGGQITEEMPWLEYRNMTDAELSALWAYLSSLEPLPDNQ